MFAYQLVDIQALNRFNARSKVLPVSCINSFIVFFWVKNRILFFRLLLSFENGNFALVFQDGIAGEFKKAVQKFCPLLHVEGKAALRVVFDQINVGRNDAVELADVLVREVVFGHRNIAL